MLAARQPTIVKEWTMADFPDVKTSKRRSGRSRSGMQAFVKARCNQCHVVAGHGVNLGPDLAESVKKLQGQQAAAADPRSVQRDQREVSEPRSSS